VGFYRCNLPHSQKDYKAPFITFTTKRRESLPEWAKDIVLRCCLHGHGTTYNLYAAMIMPDHVHLVLTPSVDMTNRRIYPLYEILRRLKGYSAKLINDRRGHGHAVWQEESFDHVLRSSESLDAKIAHILANPVRAGLSITPDEYPWK